MSQIVLAQEPDPVRRIRQLVENLNRLIDCTPSIDVSQAEYLTPLTVLPLAAYLNIHCNVLPTLEAHPQSKVQKLEQIAFPGGISDLASYESLDVIPICRIFVDGRDNQGAEKLLNSVTQQFSELLTKFLGAMGEDVSKYVEPVAYFLSEISDNVHQHAEATRCWIYANFWKNRGELELCIVDDGIGIKRRYDKTGHGIKDHLDAIEHAIRGQSTKLDRGYGIGSMIRMYTSEEALGQVCLISGDACYLSIAGGPIRRGFIPAFWQGVIFSVRLTRPKNIIKAVKYASG